METGLRRLRYFNTLATELNFRRSAEKLNITQPALSRAIAQLEDEVGTQLVERNNRHVRLTAAGANFADGCAELLTGLGATIDQTLKVAQGFAGSITVGYTDTAIAGRLPDLIKSFLGQAPDIEVRLIQMYSTQQLEAFGDGAIDIGIMTGPVKDAALQAVEVQIDRFVGLVPRDNALAARRTVTLLELAQYPFVLGDSSAWGVYNALLFAECEAHGVRPNIVQAAPESRAIVGLVACGLGVSILPECLTRCLDERIVALPVSDVSGRMVTQAVWPKACANPAVNRFGAYLAATACRAAP